MTDTAPPLPAPAIPPLRLARRLSGAGAVSLSLAAAAGLHLAALPSHAREGLDAGAFFAAVAVLQLAAAAVVGRGATPTGRRLIVAGNLGLIALWLLSRTAGIPVGAHAGVAEPVSSLDALAVGVEVLAIGGLVLLGRRRHPAAASTTTGRLAALVLAFLVIGGAGTALAEPHGHPAEPEHHVREAVAHSHDE